MIRDEILHPKMLQHLGEVSGEMVLDIGGGEGILSRELTKRGATAIDGDGVFDLVKAAAEGAPPVPATQLSATDTLPFPPNYFDKAASNLLLMWLPEIQTIAREAHRILKPGGKFIASITHPMVNLGEFEMSNPDKPMLRLQASLKDGVWLKMINETNGPYPYYQRSPAQYVNTFTNAGLHLVPGSGYDDVFFTEDFIDRYPKYKAHEWYPLFLILAFEKSI